jgi:hypothetical protein
VSLPASVVFVTAARDSKAGRTRGNCMAQAYNVCTYRAHRGGPSTKTSATFRTSKNEDVEKKVFPDTRFSFLWVTHYFETMVILPFTFM